MEQDKIVVVVGDCGVGKTALIERLTTGRELKYYIPSVGVFPRPYLCATEFGNIQLALCELPSLGPRDLLRAPYYAAAAAVIVLTSGDDWLALEGLQYHSQEAKLYAPGRPILACFSGDTSELPAEFQDLRILPLSLRTPEGIVELKCEIVKALLGCGKSML